MPGGEDKIPLVFFRNSAGSEPVRKWLKELSEIERRAIGRDLTDLPDEADGARFGLPSPRTPCGVARLHQKDAGHARRRLGSREQAQEGAGTMSKKHMGSSIDDFMKEEGIFEEAQANAIKEVVAWQLARAMKKKKISKNRMAALLKTSRTQVDRLLNARDDITLSSLQRAAAVVGCRISIELV